MSKMRREDFPKTADNLIGEAQALHSYLKAELQRAKEIISGDRHLPGAVSTLDQYLDTLYEQINNRVDDVTALVDTLRECYRRPPLYNKDADQGG